ncbi:unnamed protein product, partial [Allacma fusca]
MSINKIRPNDKPLSLTGSNHKRRSGVSYEHLPRHVKPTKYIICFKPRWEDATFEGSVIIHATIKKVTSEIVMHAADLTIGKIKWEEDITENRQEPLEYSLDEDNELLKIKFDPPLYPNEGTLRINFNGTIYTEGYKGMYRSNRLAQDLVDTPNLDYNLLTNFRPTQARRCFPCWDEPTFKASFEICFVVPINYTALSNMPLKVSYAHRSNVQFHIVECLRSPKMSTHAIGFCIDLVVLPDVASEAVRNWGIITCRDTSIFADQDSTPMFLQDLCSLMAYEVARQWFGNLVTVEWFDHLWLHQGLAVFTAHLAMEKFAPQFQIWNQFVSNICIPALEADSSRYSLAIESSVNNLADYSDLNSSVTVMQQVSDKPVLDLFSSWVKVPGYPLIRVSSKQDGRFRTFTLTQERFIEHHPASNPKDKDTRSSKEIKDRRDPLWIIPITFASEDSDNLLTTVLDKKTAKFTISIGKTHWVTINPGHYEYFRVRYSPDCFTMLMSAVRQKTLPIIDRMSLLSDLDAMTLNGLSSTGELLSVLEAYADETDYAVWKVIVSITTRLDFLVDSTDYYKLFQTFIRIIFSRIADKTNFEKLDGDEDNIRVFFKMYLESESLEEKGRIAQSIGAVQDSDNVKLILDFAMTEDVRNQHAVAIFQSLSSYS